MAIYYCHHCRNLRDGDWNTPSKDPRPGKGLELVCEGCITEIEEELEDEMKAVRNTGSFTPAQQAEIDRLTKDSENGEG